MNEKYENKMEDCQIKFSHNQNVEIIKGFYKGYTGIITGYIVKVIELEDKSIKNNKIYYNVHIESLSTTLLIDEQDLKDVKRTLMNKIFGR